MGSWQRQSGKSDYGAKGFACWRAGLPVLRIAEFEVDCEAAGDDVAAEAEGGFTGGGFENDLFLFVEEDFGFAALGELDGEVAFVLGAFGEEADGALSGLGGEVEFFEGGELRADFDAAEAGFEGPDSGEALDGDVDGGEGAVAPLLGGVGLGGPVFLDGVVEVDGGHGGPTFLEVFDDGLGLAGFGEGPESPAGVGGVGEAHGWGCIDEGPDGGGGVVIGALVEEDGGGEGAVAGADVLFFGEPGEVIDELAVLSAPELADDSGVDTGAEVIGGFGGAGVLHGAGDGGEGTAEHGDGVEVEGADFVALFLEGLVVEPDGGGAEVFDGEQAVVTDAAEEVIREADEAGVGFAEGVEITGVEEVEPAIEGEADAVVEDGAPGGELELAFHEAGEAVIGGPAVEEVAILGEALAEGFEVAGGQA
ncbi:MAG: hypothetical protein RI897_1542 [Verrucomicrobiota bacterium]